MPGRDILSRHSGSGGPKNPGDTKDSDGFYAAERRFKPWVFEPCGAAGGCSRSYQSLFYNVDLPCRIYQVT